jgi:hypothetical protein
MSSVQRPETKKQKTKGGSLLSRGIECSLPDLMDDVVGKGACGPSFSDAKRRKLRKLITGGSNLTLDDV